MTLTGSSLSGNTATGNGGGLANAGTAPAATFTRSPVSGNTALGNGGGIYNRSPPTPRTTARAAPRPCPPAPPDHHPQWTDGRDAPSADLTPHLEKEYLS